MATAFALILTLGCKSGTGDDGLTATLPQHTVSFINHCDQQIWLASNNAAPTAASEWALAPRCKADTDCATGQTCDSGSCTCTTDTDCAFGSAADTKSTCNAGHCASTTQVELAGGWSGRFWARTGCSGTDNAFVCDTGQCGPASGGPIDCSKRSANQATLFELFASGVGGIDNFDVSLVSGYNVPVRVAVDLPADSAQWAPNTSYKAPDRIIEKIGENTFGFTAAGKAGTSGTTKPVFPATWSEQVSDGSDIVWVNVGPLCQTSGCVADLLDTCPTELQLTVGSDTVACDAPANACVPTTATCNDALPYYQCQNNDGAKDLFGNVLVLQSPNADTFVCFSEDDCPAGTTCQLNPEFESGTFTFPAGAGLCTPVTQNGACTPADDGMPCPARTFPFVEYQCQTLKNVTANAQVCVPPITNGFGNLWWNAANWVEVSGITMCTKDSDCLTAQQKCLADPFMGGVPQCPEGDTTCSCYSPQTCATSGAEPNGGCPGPRQCLDAEGVPDGTGSVDCTKVTCYCGPQAVYSGTCGPTNAAWNSAATGVGDWPSVFKKACPVAYAYQFDDPSSDWACPNPADDLVNYQVEFCLGDGG